MTEPPQCRAVFLDRDGVINRPLFRKDAPCPPQNLEELELCPGVGQALERLRGAGFRLVVVTNQPDVARGTIALAAVEEINRYLCDRLPIDAVEVCYHDDIDRCSCRKPAPGMLLTAAKRDGIDLSASYMVGDRWRDVEAGLQAGCTAILVGDGYKEGLRSAPHVSVNSLVEAAAWILEEKDSKGAPL